MSTARLLPLLLVATVGVEGISAAAVPECGPRSIQSFLDQACDGLSRWDPRRPLCRGATAAGTYLTGGAIEEMAGTCCQTHDRCYAARGTQQCKSACDRAFERCVEKKVNARILLVHPEAYIFLRWGVPWLADNVGGDLLGAFHENGDATCGRGLPAPDPRVTIAADFNGDGREDLVFWWRDTGLNRFFLGRVDGTYDFVESPIPLPAINGGDEWNAADYNGDGAADLLFWWKGSGINRLFLSRKDGGFAAAEQAIAPQALNNGDQWIHGDFNGDEIDDVLFYWKQDGSNRLFLAGRDGILRASAITPIPMAAINNGDQWISGDFNGDGLADLAFWWRAEGGNRVFFGARQGAFTTTAAAAIEPLAINGGQDWSAGDFNGDGVTDLLFWWRDSGVNRLFLGSRSGGITGLAESPLPILGVNNGDRWVIDDYDGDGIDDVMFWWASEGSNRLFFGTPTGQFIPTAAASIDERAINGGHEVRSGDVDGDGAADLVFWWPDGTNRMFLSQRRQGFRPAPAAVIAPTAIN